MCCSCSSSSNVREGASLAPSLEKIIHAALLSNNPESCLKKVIAISLETFKSSSFIFSTNQAFFDDILESQEDEINILFIEECEGSQEMLSLIEKKIQKEGAEIFRNIPIIYISNDRVVKSFIKKQLPPPKNVRLGGVVDISRIFSQRFPHSERQKPSTRFYPVL